MALLAAGSWWVWREFYSEEQFRKAFEDVNYDRAEMLFRTGADTGSYSGLTLLHIAVLRGDAKKVQQLIKSGMDVNAEYNPDMQGFSTGITPLFSAALYDHVEVAQILLSSGANVNARIKNYQVSHGHLHAGSLPLHIAVSRGYYEMTKLLLEYNADVRLYLPEDDGWTVLHYVQTIGKGLVRRDPQTEEKLRIRIARLLLLAGADPRQKDSIGNSAIDLWPKLEEIVKEMNSGAAR